MKKLLLLTALLAAFTASAQPADSLSQARRTTLTEARYLKSIFKTDEAIERLSTLVKPESFDEEVLAELADCHFTSGDYTTAAGTYQLLALRNPDNILYQIRQMQLAFRMKDYRASAALGRDILARDSIPAVAALAGDAWNLAGQGDSALVYYRQALALKPFNETVVSKAANLLLADKDYDSVIAMADDYLALDPDNFTVAPIRGLAWYLKSEYDSSLVVFQRLEDLGADNYPLHYYLGQSYWHTNVPYMAERELLKAWAIDSSDANLAWTIAAVKVDDYRSFEDDVRHWLDKATAMLQPDSSLVSRIQQQYAVGEYRQGNLDQAIVHYKEAYRYNPQFISALSTIAYCYEMKKQHKLALEYYERYLKFAKPGSNGYNFAKKSVEMIKAELFMEE